MNSIIQKVIGEAEQYGFGDVVQVTAEVPVPEEYDEIAKATGVDAHTLERYGNRVYVIRAGSHIVGLVNALMGANGCQFAPGRRTTVEPLYRQE